ncbi:MMPL family transporter [Nocardia camponoti]|uniref:Conserved membrane protein, MmpL family n=1 Tax=Nocardia camponoti TaxID=1616106 RepID=A0A917QIS2_9NOCA|nr:MMPL family transporter [Nocardia camponoti]GGK51796.1 putative conserved membrane protein, MmpL family [Nocardia camponoti]
MLTRIARLGANRPRWVVAVALLLMILSGAVGATVHSHMKSGGFVTEDLDSYRAAESLRDNFPGSAPNYVLLVTTPDSVDSPAATEKAAQVAAALSGRPEVLGVQSYWTTRPDLRQALRSHDGKRALIMASVAGDDGELPIRAAALSKAFETDGPVSIQAGGLIATYDNMNTQISKDLVLAEAVAIPVTGLLLAIVFGSVVAAALPIAIGLFAIAAALGILRVLTGLTDVSIFALNMTTALGLALAIDYSLFIVSRYREELAAGRNPHDAVIRSVQTAGRTVVYSALVVALSLAALLVFPQYFFKSFAYAGIAVVAAATVAAVVVLPALLILVGDRINAWDLRVPLRKLFRVQPQRDKEPTETFWYRLVIAVMKRPIPVALATTALLLLLGSPFLHVAFGYPDDRSLPTTSSARQVGDILRTEFDADLASSATIVLPEFSGDSAEIGAYAKALSQVEGVPAVLSSDAVYRNGLRVAAGIPQMIDPAHGAYVSVGTKFDPYSAEGGAQLDALRAVPSPGEALIAGPAALNQDSVTAIIGRVPLAGLLIAITTLVLLFLFTGSVVLPIKALILNILSLAATFGAMVWVFQEGHLSGLLGFTATGTLNLAMPILMFSLAFGASMDYEVFLLSRIREEWLAGPKTTEGNTQAVALGVARTGRIFTAAALLMSIVFLGVATSGVSMMKLFGLGCALAVISDATVIRGLLAPALMRMMGTLNWWAPKPLVALHNRFGMHEGESPHTEAELATASR